MKALLNTLYVTTQGAYLARDGETLAVRVEHETRLRIPIHTLSAVVCFGQVTCSAPAMGLCAESGVGLSFLTEHGRFLARVQGPISGNVLLRRTQYRCADEAGRAESIARLMVIGKVANSRTVLLRAAREKPAEDGAANLDHAAKRLARILEELQKPLYDGLPGGGVDSVRAQEGDAARTYFGVFNDLIQTSKDSFFFHGRSRRPPTDNMNALLSFVYTLLTHDTAAALEGVGLDPAVGYLHCDRPGRASLALDLVEELRPVLGDRLALSLVNRRQVQSDGFRTAEGGAVLMDDQTRKAVLVAYQTRKQEEIVHPYLQERMPFGLVPHVQANLLARHLRGDLPVYPPFLWK